MVEAELREALGETFSGGHSVNDWRVRLAFALVALVIVALVLLLQQVLGLLVALVVGWLFAMLIRFTYFYVRRTASHPHNAAASNSPPS